MTQKVTLIWCSQTQNRHKKDSERIDKAAFTTFTAREGAQALLVRWRGRERDSRHRIRAVHEHALEHLLSLWCFVHTVQPAMGSEKVVPEEGGGAAEPAAADGQEEEGSRSRPSPADGDQAGKASKDGKGGTGGRV